jgi:DNA-binding transcriptional ArsR family regulator
MQNCDQLDKTFAALADPTRRAILARLASGEATVSEIMRPFKISQPAISRHLKVLEHAGLISGERDAQRRPRTLVAAPLKNIAEWVEGYRHFWEQKFARLDLYLSDLQKKRKRHPHEPIRRNSLWRTPNVRRSRRSRTARSS